VSPRYKHCGWYAKYIDRQPGQGGTADPPVRDLRAQLLRAEAAHFSKSKASGLGNSDQTPDIHPTKRPIEAAPETDGEVSEDPDAKRRRILEETRDIDADSSESKSDNSDEERLAALFRFGDYVADGQ
jgi:protein CWC15